jgi:2-keto-4-pentenoate hydratase/2-oxohepta-3-ene-1,7-dioic acid hydratase in catechol pathway
MIPLAAPSKIVCVGRNYLAHAAELGNVLPEEPLLFFKPPSSLVGPGDPIRVPHGVGRVDFEGEIGIVMGRRARSVPEKEAATYVDAVLALNDVTARDLQRKDNQWARAKGFDTFCAVGAPVPADILDLAELSVVTRVNGEERQRGRARDMAFSIPFLIAYVSAIMTLEPGDILATGTPEGVGPLSVGDTVEVEIPGVSVVSNPVEARGEP